MAQMLPLAKREFYALAYVVRFDPEAARPILAHASENPNEVTTCDFAPLYGISKFVQDPVLTEAAVRAVSSPCANVVEDALMYLERFGDKSARQPILDRYLQWSERWTGKSEKPTDEESPEDSGDRRLGVELARALLGNQAWVADSALIAVVVQHCFGRDMCDSVTRFTKQAFDVSVTQSPDGTHYRIGWCWDIPSLKLFEAKLDQFPEGTTFTLVQTESDSAHQREIEGSLPVLLAKHGMKVRAVGP